MKRPLPPAATVPSLPPVNPPCKEPLPVVGNEADAAGILTSPFSSI